MNVQKILGLLQGCHSILSLGWPKPGIPEMSGARVFIGTKPFFALKDGIRQANREFELFSAIQKMKSTCEAWHLVGEIVNRFEALGRQSESKAIDPAFNLIYLTTGVLYHHISTMFSVVPEHVQPYAIVDDIERLLHDCLEPQVQADVETGALLTWLIGRLGDHLTMLQN